MPKVKLGLISMYSNKYHYVYRITCLNEMSVEKYYYGSRSSKLEPKSDDYWSSSKYIKIAIDKFGIKYFKKKIIKTFLTREDALKYEMLLHEKFSVDKNPIFFNKSKASNFGIKITGLFSKDKTYEELYGEEKAKKLKIIRAENFKKIDKNGIKNPMYGKKHSEEMKMKLSIDRQGEKHPAFKSFWITNGKENIKLKYGSKIPSGFYLGRTHSFKENFQKALKTKIALRQIKIDEYYKNPKKCLYCNSNVISYEQNKRGASTCCRSCTSNYVNSKKN